MAETHAQWPAVLRRVVCLQRVNSTHDHLSPQNLLGAKMIVAVLAVTGSRRGSRAATRRGAGPACQLHGGPGLRRGGRGNWRGLRRHRRHIAFPVGWG
jgi:hypothetical protein